MEIYTVGFAGKTARAFFGALKSAGVKRVIDIRLRPNGGLSLFARGTDLPYFLRELCEAEYTHVPLLAPTKELLADYRKKKIDWPEYERRFLAHPIGDGSRERAFGDHHAHVRNRGGHPKVAN